MFSASDRKNINFDKKVIFGHLKIVVQITNEKLYNQELILR